MHKLIAQIYWSEGNLERARLHFLVSKDGIACGQMLIELSQTKGSTKEVDLFIVQVILQQLSMKEFSTAVETFETYTKFHPKIACTEPPFNMTLINFLYFLLNSVNTKKLQFFQTLCELYKPSLDRDASYEKYLERIGINYFNAPAPQPARSGGIFGNFINQLVQDLDADDAEPRSSNTLNNFMAVETSELD